MRLPVCAKSIAHWRRAMRPAASNEWIALASSACVSSPARIGIVGALALGREAADDEGPDRRGRSLQAQALSRTARCRRRPSRPSPSRRADRQIAMWRRYWEIERILARSGRRRPHRRSSPPATRHEYWHPSGAQGRSGLDSDHPGDGRGVVGKVQPVASAELEHGAREPVEESPAKDRPIEPVANAPQASARIAANVIRSSDAGGSCGSAGTGLIRSTPRPSQAT
jgi:hypothetical protein